MASASSWVRCGARVDGSAFTHQQLRGCRAAQPSVQPMTPTRAGAAAATATASASGQAGATVVDLTGTPRKRARASAAAGTNGARAAP